ncbi:hypothetical protein RchiOBHm_Chr2g0155331 [Rosa chinensis]|uniref:Uncharacterized protein n=1 Tax=Rosa chinensis TaxID=74649 RepID=A0A2P6S161_ROSCH|nr:hypothetical protein RchiOBHm_Chr2g0155331 [Rosa chinensis]
MDTIEECTTGFDCPTRCYQSTLFLGFYDLYLKLCLTGTARRLGSDQDATSRLCLWDFVIFTNFECYGNFSKYIMSLFI